MSTLHVTYNSFTLLLYIDKNGQIDTFYSNNVFALMYERENLKNEIIINVYVLKNQRDQVKNEYNNIIILNILYYYINYNL